MRRSFALVILLTFSDVSAQHVSDERKAVADCFRKDTNCIVDFPQISFIFRTDCENLASTQRNVVRCIAKVLKLIDKESESVKRLPTGLHCMDIGLQFLMPCDRVDNSPTNQLSKNFCALAECVHQKFTQHNLE